MSAAQLTRYRFTFPGQALVSLAGGRLKAYGKLAATDGDLVYVRAFGQDLYWVNDPSLADEVLIEKASAFRKGRVLDRARRLFGDGLLTSDGDTHRRHRRLVGHGFHASRMRAYAEQMVSLTRDLCERWDDADSIDLSREMVMLTLNIVSSTLFGVSVQREADAITSALGDALKDSSPSG